MSPPLPQNGSSGHPDPAPQPVPPLDLPDDFAGRPALLLRWFERDARDHARAAWIFLRVLGVVYLAAFASLGVQVHGLIGSNGLLPAQNYLDAAQRHYGADAWLKLPTLGWFDCSDSTLTLFCGFGVCFALLLILDLAPAIALFALWALYLSLSILGQSFLGFQWDTLLLETGLLAIFLAPWRLKPRWRDPEPPSWIALWLLRWLLFRLMFTSGVVKLMSGDPTWRNLTALSYHYLTQPLPHAFGWLAHQLPAAIHKVSTVAMFVIELLLPFGVFTPNVGRRIAAIGLAGLMLMIGLTGNYGFFNLLSAALCLLLLDDRFLTRATFWRRDKQTPSRQRLAVESAGAHTHAPSPLTQHHNAAADYPPGIARRLTQARRLIAAFVALVVFPTSTLMVLGQTQLWRPSFANTITNATAPLRSINRYGLFAVMTTTRPEILIEASMDGETWQPYVLPYKPGPLDEPPRFAGLHMPRLDWQLWFASLGTIQHQRNRWVVTLLVQLLNNTPEVVGLFERVPFPNQRPEYIRAVSYDYTFTAFGDEGWWKRSDPRPYTPVISQRDLTLANP